MIVRIYVCMEYNSSSYDRMCDDDEDNCTASENFFRYQARQSSVLNTIEPVAVLGAQYMCMQ